MNTRTDLIGEMVAEDFRTAAVFKKYGIDFCCRGGRTIEDACKDKTVDAETIYNELENIPNQSNNNIDFKSWPLDLLVEYVEKTHHAYVEEKTPILLAFLDKLCKVHGERHPELFEINKLFNETAQELSAHLKKEELILFPFIKKMANAKRKGSTIEAPAFGTIENPVHMMEHEHTTEGDRVAKISALSNQYTPPADGCNTYKVAYAMLQEFENDLHTHIHIENNILFPKSIELEKEFNS
ncbi:MULTISPECIES: iron-sulfur cluster repair di-iron protein [unclassified Empedobacter]|uniref:iron-sulfur cluster repair di-iron protein n=1 Tax=unclassified Empedobacter TaxID=2643773 RepID=UPI0025C431BA|nr:MULTISPECIES: iron-sulfur cluster repair di-iron protein [unclassified Empedobacter]